MSDEVGPGSTAEESHPVPVAPVRILGTFAKARPVTACEAAAAVGTVVKVTGQAVPGPGGPLRAPLSGAECVWYRSIVLRSPRAARAWQQVPLRPLPPIAPSDLPDYGVNHRAGARGQRWGTDTSSTVPFAVTDGTASLRIDPRATDMDSDVFAVNERVVVDAKDRPHAAGLELRAGLFGPDEVHAEWILPVGAQVLALGTVHHDAGVAALAPHGEDVALVSTKPEQQILTRNQAAVDGPHLPVTNPRTVVLLVTGTVLVVAAVIVALLLV